MKKIISLVLVLIMSFGCFSIISFAETTGLNDHITEVPEGYKGIYTIEDLYCIRNDLTANYILMNDIDLSEATAEGGDWNYGDRGWNPIGSNDVYSNSSFSGVFDGNNYIVKGMSISITELPSGTNNIYLGLFSSVSGLIKNLTVAGKIYAGISTANDIYAGGIAGYCTGTIENCINRVNISVGNNYEPTFEDGIYNVFVGGISGYSTAKIFFCKNVANLFAYVTKGYYANSYPPKKYYSTAYAAGICGVGGAVNCCVNSGDITTRSYGSYGKSYSSGIVHSGTVKNSYNLGNIKSELKKASVSYAYAAGIGYDASCSYCYNVGLVVGEAGQKAISNNSSTKCYYLADVGSNSTGAVSLTDAQMKLKSMYTDWNFDTIWTIDGRDDYFYPELQDVELILQKDPIHQHKYTSEITTPATHMADGIITYICECGDAYIEAIEKIADHQYKTRITAPTCIKQGFTTYTCECGDTYIDNYVDKRGHDFKAIITEPTCTEHGYTAYICECGESYTRDYESAKGHSYSSIITKPTCNSKGYTTYTCACGNSYIDEYVSVVAHKDNNKDYKCDYDCGYEFEKPTPEEPSKNCSCNCHKSGFAGFIWKITVFFNKLFKTNRICPCGTAHY